LFAVGCFCVYRFLENELMMNYINFFNRLSDATDKNQAEWEEISSICLIGEFDSFSFIICRYFDSERDEKIAKFVQLNEIGFDMRDTLRLWTQKDAEWESFNILFDKLEETYVS